MKSLALDPSPIVRGTNPRCLAPIEAVQSHLGDLSARNVAHRNQQAFEEQIRSCTWMLKNALEHHQDSSKNQRNLQMIFTRAFAHHRLHQYARAIEDYNACLLFDPAWAVTYYNRGCAQFALGNMEEAIKDFGKAIQYDNKNTVFVESRAMLLKASGRFQQAIQDYAWLESLRRNVSTHQLQMQDSIKQQHQPKKPQQPKHMLTRRLGSMLRTGSMALTSDQMHTMLMNSVDSIQHGSHGEGETLEFFLQYLRVRPKARKKTQTSQAARLARGWDFFRGMDDQLIARCLEASTLAIYSPDTTVVTQGSRTFEYMVVLNKQTSLVQSVVDSIEGTVLSKEFKQLTQGHAISNQSPCHGADGGFHVLETAQAAKRRLAIDHIRSSSLMQLLTNDDVTTEPKDISLYESDHPEARKRRNALKYVGPVTSSSPSGVGGGGGGGAKDQHPLTVQSDVLDVEMPLEVYNITCLDELLVLQMDISLVRRFLGESEQHLLQQRVEFLRGCRAFGTLDNETLVAMAVLAHTKLFDPGQVMLQVADEIKSLVVIRRGVCQVHKGIHLPNYQQFMDHNHHETSHGDGSWVLDSTNNAQQLFSSHDHHQQQARVRPQPDLRPQTSSMISNGAGLSPTTTKKCQSDDDQETDFNVGTLASGQLFGEMSVLQPFQEHTSTVQILATTMVEVLVLDAKVLTALNVQYNPVLMNALQESLRFHNPSEQKVVQLFYDHEVWNIQKHQLLVSTFGPNGISCPSCGNSGSGSSPIRSPHQQRANTPGPGGSSTSRPDPPQPRASTTSTPTRKDTAQTPGTSPQKHRLPTLIKKANK